MQHPATAFAAFAFALISHAPSTKAERNSLDDDAIKGAYPVVITPTRLRQSTADVPAAVTVITAETIRAFGIRRLIDALRLVPGMAITEASGNDFRVNYHGTNILGPRRMNVLIDGVSVYRSGLARVDWKEIPVAIDDIARIEVTRGPNSAAYGPNSLLGIVNIITKHPNDVGQLFAAITGGTQDTAEATVRVAGSIGSTALRATADLHRDSGYDSLSRAAEPHDSTRLARFNLRAVTRLSERSELDTTAALVHGTKQVPFVERFQISFPDQEITDVYLGTTWRMLLSPTHEIQAQANYSENRVRQEWTTCIPALLLLPELFDLWRANPALANMIAAGRPPSGGTPLENQLAARAVAAIRALGQGVTSPICSTPDQNLRQSRTDMQVQDTYVFSPQFRMVAGLGAREDRGTSQTFFGGTLSNRAYRVFANAEYKPHPRLRFNFGGYYEKDDLVDASFSPRVAANFDITGNQTVRFIVSEGTRAPDLFEQRANWTYSVDDFSPPLNGSTTGRFYQSAHGPGNLKSEKIVNREIGYIANIPPLGMITDVKVFNDSLTDLISQKLQVSDFMPTNDGRLTLRGAELQTTLAPAPEWRVFVNYAYLQSKDALFETERTQYSRHSGAVGVARSYASGWHWSLAYFGASGDGIGQSAYGRTDLHLANGFAWGTSRVSAALMLSYLTRRVTSYYRDRGDFLSSAYDDRLQAFLTVRIGL